jgi:hypothetical protein
MKITSYSKDQLTSSALIKEVISIGQSMIDLITLADAVLIQVMAESTDMFLSTAGEKPDTRSLVDILNKLTPITNQASALSSQAHNTLASIKQRIAANSISSVLDGLRTILDHINRTSAVMPEWIFVMKEVLGKYDQVYVTQIKAIEDLIADIFSTHNDINDIVSHIDLPRISHFIFFFFKR